MNTEKMIKEVEKRLQGGDASFKENILNGYVFMVDGYIFQAIPFDSGLNEPFYTDDFEDVKQVIFYSHPNELEYDEWMAECINKEAFDKLEPFERVREIVDYFGFMELSDQSEPTDIDDFLKIILQ